MINVYIWSSTLRDNTATVDNSRTMWILILLSQLSYGVSSRLVLHIDGFTRYFIFFFIQAQCKPLEEPEYGIVSPGLAQGITVNYSCEWGFELNGTRSVECQNATWSVHTTPTCDGKSIPMYENENLIPFPQFWKYV